MKKYILLLLGILSKLTVEAQTDLINLVPNSQFELTRPNSTSYSYVNPQMECYHKGCTEMEDLFRNTQALHWTIWLGSKQNNSCIMTELVKTTNTCFTIGSKSIAGNIMHVKTTYGGMGIVNSSIGDNGNSTPSKVSCWVYVVKGKVNLGYGSTGKPITSVVSKTLCKWEKLEVTKSGKELCNQIIIYADNSGDAEFYVDDISCIKL